MPLLKSEAGRGAPRLVLEYVMREGKAAYVDAVNLMAGDSEYIAKQFTDTAGIFGKGKRYAERKYYHYKLSPDPKDNITPEDIQRYALEFVKEAFPGELQTVVATHTDSGTVHAHIVVNAVNPVTGNKLHYELGDFKKMKEKANEVGLRFGLTPMDFSKKSKTRFKQGELHALADGKMTKKETLRELIVEGVRAASSKEEYEAFMLSRGVTFTRAGKEYGYLLPGESRAVRGGTVGDLYRKENLLDVIYGRNGKSKERFFDECERSLGVGEECIGEDGDYIEGEPLGGSEDAERDEGGYGDYIGGWGLPSAGRYGFGEEKHGGGEHSSQKDFGALPGGLQRAHLETERALREPFLEGGLDAREHAEDDIQTLRGIHDDVERQLRRAERNSGELRKRLEKGDGGLPFRAEDGDGRGGVGAFGESGGGDGDLSEDSRGGPHGAQGDEGRAREGDEGGSPHEKGDGGPFKEKY